MIGSRALKSNAVRLSAAVLAGAVLLLLAMEWLLLPLTVDDAYISYHYAANLAAGHGLVWHPGDDPVEGYSNFLWVLALAGFIKLGIEAGLAAKVLGVLCSLGSVGWMVRIVRRMDPENSGALPAVLLAASPAFALWAVSGLETALFIFILLAALDRVLVEEAAGPATQPGRPPRYWSVLWLMLLGMARPEGALVFILLVALRFVLWYRDPASRPRLRAYTLWVLVIGGISLVYFLWRWRYFGYPLPNTFYVKAGSGLGEIARQIGVYLVPYALRLFPFILLAVYAAGAGRKKHIGDTYIGAALASFLLLNLLSSDWMPGHRLALPMTPLIFLLAREPLEAILARATGASPLRERAAFAAIGLALVAYALTPFLYAAPLFNRVMATQMDMSIYRWSEEMQTIVDGQYARVGEWLADHAPDDCTVIAGNVGAIAYLSGCRIVDQIGLTHETIARNGWTVDYLLGMDPEFIVIESDTPDAFGGLYGTGGDRWLRNETFLARYELLFVLDNDRYAEPALFIHHLPHATWLYARTDLGLGAGASEP